MEGLCLISGFIAIFFSYRYWDTGSKREWMISCASGLVCAVLAVYSVSHNVILGLVAAAVYVAANYLFGKVQLPFAIAGSVFIVLCWGAGVPAVYAAIIAVAVTLALLGNWIMVKPHMFMTWYDDATENWKARRTAESVKAKKKALGEKLAKLGLRDACVAAFADKEGEFVARYDELLAKAQSGDADARYELGSLISQSVRQGPADGAPWVSALTVFLEDPFRRGSRDEDSGQTRFAESDTAKQYYKHIPNPYWYLKHRNSGTTKGYYNRMAAGALAGLCYEYLRDHGFKIEQSDAIAWLELAAGQGHEAAKAKLADIGAAQKEWEMKRESKK